MLQDCEGNDFRVCWARDLAADQVPSLGADNPGEGGSFLLWGDSHAGAIAPALDRLAKERGVKGYLVYFGGTPPLTRYGGRPRPWSLSASEQQVWSQSVVDFVRRRKIEQVVLAGMWSTYIFQESPMNAEDLRQTLRELSQAGARRVWLFKEVPMQSVNGPRAVCLADKQIGLWPTGVSREAFDRQNKPMELLLGQLQPAKVTLLDPTELLFDSVTGRFPICRDGHLLYLNGFHISRWGSLQLTPIFQPLFQPTDAKTTQ
jgi:hypothetical protein